MKKIFAKLFSGGKHLYALAVLGVYNCFMKVQLALASSGGGGDSAILSQVSGNLQGVKASVIALARIAFILATIACFIMAGINLLKQERDSVSKAIGWAIGLVAGLAAFTALGSVS